jgi:hypothetical protein
VVMKPLVSLQILTIVAILVLLPALGDMHSLLIRDVSAIAARPPVKGDFAGIALRVDFPDLKGSTPANDTLSILTFA